MRYEGPGARRPAGWLPWPVSLRARLLAAALCLLATGAAASTGACGLAARGYLMAQADSQLRASADHLTGHQLRRPLSIIHGAAAAYRRHGQLSTGDVDRMMRQVTDQAARIEALADVLSPTGHEQRA